MPIRQTKAKRSLIALIFISMFAVLTCTNHFLYLTVLNKVTFESSNLNSILSLGNWPSLVMAVDYLAWGLFLGLALLFAAASFKGDRLRSALRWTFVFSGTLCILGVVGVALIDPLLWFVSVTGYGLGFPIISILLTMLYIKSKWLSS